MCELYCTLIAVLFVIAFLWHLKRSVELEDRDMWDRDPAAPEITPPERVAFWRLVAIGVALAFAIAYSCECVVGAEPSADELVAWAPTQDYRRVGDFLLSFDGRTRCARWTLEHLTPASLKAQEANRSESRFTVDATIPAEFRPRRADYAGTGFDIGHCAAAANHLRSAEALQATFTPANAAPQAAALNRGPWRALEHYLRGVAERTRGVRVVTAPLWLNNGVHEVCTKRDGANACVESRRVTFYRFEALGEGAVWIPTHWGKAALIEHADGRLEARAWILANVNAPAQPDFEECETSIDRFEAAAGLDVFAPLPDDQEAALERGE